MSERIAADSLVTLHYRIAGTDGEGFDDTFVATFGATPATLQMGNGELAPALEHCLIGLPVGERRSFTLDPDQAFGAPLPQLVQRIPRARLPQGKGNALQAMTLLEFDAPNGARFAGLVREMDEDTALIDFNHPLAGKAIRFEVEVIGVL